VTAETGELAAGLAAALAHGRRALITGMLVNLTFHYSKLFSAGVDVDTALGVALIGVLRLT
jgi:arabinogalactan endo-1,4-beta-galactosidase